MHTVRNMLNRITESTTTSYSVQRSSLHYTSLK